MPKRAENSGGRVTGAPTPPAAAKFLEKLLVHQVISGHVVEPNRIDGKVRFRLDIPEADNAVYLIVHVDKDYETLFGTGVHPDYLVIYISAVECIWTIVEIKRGSDPHAVDQICAYLTKLRGELRKCLHPAIMPHFQAIIIGPAFAQPPLEKIKAAQSASNIIIRHHKVRGDYDIRQYVSQKMSEATAYAAQRFDKTRTRISYRAPNHFERLAHAENGRYVHRGKPLVRASNEDSAVQYVSHGEKLVLHFSVSNRRLRVCVPRDSAQLGELTHVVAVAGLDRLFSVDPY